MHVFIASKYSPGGVSGGQWDVVADALTSAAGDAGHSAEVGWREIRERGLTSGSAWMPFVRERLARSDLLLVVYHESLRGGLIEVGIAYALGVPVWLCNRRGERVSGSALGCAAKVLVYYDVTDLRAAVRSALVGV